MACIWALIEGLSRLLAEWRLLAERRLRYLWWSCLELFLLDPYLLHLGHLMESCVWLCLCWRLLEDLGRFLSLDFLVLHGSIPALERSILVFSPLFDLVICAFNKLVSQVQQDSLSAFLDDLTTDALERVTFNVD